MGMPVLPIPMIIALVLLAFLVQRVAQRQTHVTLLALISICAVQAGLIALVRYYGFEVLRPAQPLLAMMIPPVAWFAFTWASGGDLNWRRLVWHGIGPALALASLATHPLLLDAMIPLSFLFYGVAMLWFMRQGEDSLLHSRLDGGAIALTAWRIVAVALIASAGCDVLIAYGLATGRSGFLLWVPSVVSSLSLLSLGALSLSAATESHRDVDPAGNASSDEVVVRDKAIVEKLDAYMLVQKPYLDPDLTLARLSRKLIVPAKQLSAAINRSKGVNVSKYINGLRINEACQHLSGGKPVTATIYDSGFNTKSNFNREFLRVVGKSPTDWLDEQTSAG